jgi:hypothetical protein
MCIPSTVSSKVVYVVTDPLESELLVLEADVQNHSIIYSLFTAEPSEYTQSVIDRYLQRNQWPYKSVKITTHKYDALLGFIPGCIEKAFGTTKLILRSGCETMMDVSIKSSRFSHSCCQSYSPPCIQTSTAAWG